MTRPRWLQISFRIRPPYQDLLIGLLSPLGFSGFLQDDSSFSSFLERSRWIATFRASFDQLLSRFHKEFPAVDVAYSSLPVKDRNWNAQWERSMGIVEPTKKILIKPSWRKLRRKDKGKIVIRIDPKMSFGTGHHETTRLCLVMLERYLLKGVRVLDLGTGTGILAIAAAKLGARSVVAADHEPWAVINARENVRKNRVQRTVKVLAGGIETVLAKTFDLIVCNIDLPTAVKVLPTLVQKLAAGGSLILSGMLSSDLPRFFGAFRHNGIVPVEFVEENEWVSIAFLNVHAH